MPPLSRAPRATFSQPPPSRVKVGVGFRIKIRAPAEDENGSFAMVSLGSASSNPFDASDTTARIDGKLLGSWQTEGNLSSHSDGRHFESIEFNSVKISKAGRYYLSVRIFGAPTHGWDGKARTRPSIEHLRDLDSDVFYVED
ncbi:hypothetical protein GGR54DRAFT_324102 [Hypoxylon sp. NC1633]|nr:hypothetical protein GGR54DRAFT_324102 [Hypoxylon sp. NC1633]